MFISVWLVDFKRIGPADLTLPKKKDIYKSQVRECCLVSYLQSHVNADES